MLPGLWKRTKAEQKLWRKTKVRTLSGAECYSIFRASVVSGNSGFVQWVIVKVRFICPSVKMCFDDYTLDML